VNAADAALTMHTPDAGERRALLVRAATFSLAVFLAARIIVSLIAVLVVGDVPAGGWEGAPLDSDRAVAATPGWHNVVDGAFRWDAAWFIEIAEAGYRTERTAAAYLPGYPLGIRMTQALTPFGAVTSAVIVSGLCLLGALIALYLLSTVERDEELARRTLVLMMAFPTSIVLLAPYSESLFLLGVVLAFLGARTQRWWLAAVGGSIATLTRSVGIVIIPALLFEAFSASGPDRRRATVAATVPLLGPLAYYGYWFARGDVLAPMTAQTTWERKLAWPFATIWRALEVAASGLSNGRTDLSTDLLLTVAILLPLALCFRSLRPSYQTYVVLSLLVPLVYAGERPLLSMPRFVLVLFPSFWALASLLRGRLYVITTIAFTLSSVVVAVKFMNWEFVF
jgi:hypothetical protein